MKIKMFASILIIKMLTYFYDVVFEKNVNRIDVATNVQETEEIENIKKLMIITNSKQIFQQITSQMLGSMKKHFSQVPEKVWNSLHKVWNSLHKEINYDEIIGEIIWVGLFW